MFLAPGTRLGPYEILTPLGSGGMGEVYKARDPRLGRLVAIKLLLDHRERSPEALARFEREARAAAALNHPNILRIYEFETRGELAYLVTELLEGESLLHRLETGPVPLRRAVELGAQMARGLAAAHEKGLVHRDLKPGNLWITTEGVLKILDFGLARQVPRRSASPLQGLFSSMSRSGTPAPPITREGTVLGTLGYMSPEQVRGEKVEARSDIFSLGAVLFEVFTGRRAFARNTPAETMAAILRERTSEVSPGLEALPPALRRILAHCLEKAPSRRFRSAEDIAFALEDASFAAEEPLFPGPEVRHRLRRLAGPGALLGLGLIAWALGGRPAPAPVFRQLDLLPGAIEAARFGADGRTIFYSERVAGGRPEVFALDPGSAAPRPLGLQDALLAGVSPRDELACIQGPLPTAGPAFTGTLVVRSASGGVPREVRQDVAEAVWDGRELATLGLTSAGTLRLDFPEGRSLIVCDAAVRTLAHLALDRDGGHLALVDGDPARGRAEVAVFDREGRRRTLLTKAGAGPAGAITGLAWGDGTLWGSERDGDQTEVWTLTLRGRKRTVWRGQGELQLLDVGPGGRLLLAQQHLRRSVHALDLGGAAPRDLSIQGSTQVQGFGGRNLLLLESPSLGGGTRQDRLYLRSAGGGPALALGPGRAAALSADGAWVQVDTRALGPGTLDPAWTEAYTSAGLPAKAQADPEARAKYLLFVPTGLGRPFVIPVPAGFAPTGRGAQLLADGRRILAHLAWGDSTGWVLLDRNGGPPTILTPAGLGGAFPGGPQVSPDGTRCLVSGNGLAWFIQPLAGGEPRPIPGLARGERPVAWAADSQSLFACGTQALEVPIFRLDLKRGRRTPLATFTPPGPASDLHIRTLLAEPGGGTFAIGWESQVTDLFVVESLGAQGRP